MMGPDLIVVTKEGIYLDPVLREMGLPVDGSADSCEDREIGALVTFSGIVRATEGSRQIGHLDYEHYEAMAQKEIGRLLEEARRRWPIHRAAVVHRTGAVGVGESSVIVVVAAGHRAEAFEAARFLIDQLKVSVPIWKLAPET